MAIIYNYYYGGKTMKTNTIKTVMWDADGVLWWHKLHDIRDMACDLGIVCTEELEAQFETMLKNYNMYFQNHKVTMSQLYWLIEEYMPELYVRGITGKMFLDNWNVCKTNILNPEAADLMKDFSIQGKKNIILSDWIYERQALLLKGFDLFKYIEKMYTCDGNYLKRNRRNIAQIIPPGREHEYIMIGDSLADDIAFANKVGIKSIWYNKDGKPNTTPYIPTFEVDSLAKVPKIVL